MSGIIGAGQYQLSAGWSYWPLADYYSLVPKWDAGHSVTGKVINTDDEPNRLDLVAGYGDPEPYIIATISEDDPETDTVETSVPSGTPVLTGKLWVPHGFRTEYPLSLDLVVDDLDEDEDTDPTWTNEIRIGFPAASRYAVGPDRVTNFTVDVSFEEDPYVNVRLAFGTVVFRR